MTDIGEVWLAVLRGERRRRVLVLSSQRWVRATGRALVAPEMPIAPEEVRIPWRIPFGETTFAIDRARTVSETRLLERVDQVSPSAVAEARRAVQRMS